jgi:hypothetical protein
MRSDPALFECWHVAPKQASGIVSEPIYPVQISAELPADHERGIL